MKLNPAACSFAGHFKIRFGLWMVTVAACKLSRILNGDCPSLFWGTGSYGKDVENPAPGSPLRTPHLSHWQPPSPFSLGRRSVEPEYTFESS